MIEGAHRRLAASTVSQRCATVAGDFFGGVPAGGDAYVLSWILHVWDDASAVRILGNCREVLPANGRLLVIEMILPAPGDTRTPTSADITRLVRNVTQLRQSARSTAGLKFLCRPRPAAMSAKRCWAACRVTPSASPMSAQERCRRRAHAEGPR